MIVKVQKDGKHWLLLDGIRTIDYSSVACVVTSDEDLKRQVEEILHRGNGASVYNALLNIDYSCPPWGILASNPYRFNAMFLEHTDGKKALVFFDHPAYLCDDGANTVEKIHVR